MSAARTAQQKAVRNALAFLLHKLDSDPDMVMTVSVSALLDGGELLTTSLQPANELEQAAMRGMLFTQATGLEVLP